MTLSDGVEGGVGLTHAIRVHNRLRKDLSIEARVLHHPPGLILRYRSVNDLHLPDLSILHLSSEVALESLEVVDGLFQLAVHPADLRSICRIAAFWVCLDFPQSLT